MRSRPTKADWAHLESIAAICNALGETCSREDAEELANARMRCGLCPSCGEDVCKCPCTAPVDDGTSPSDPDQRRAMRKV